MIKGIGMGSALKLQACVAGLLIASAAVAAGDIKVANEGGIKDAWTLAPGTALPVPAYPQAYADNQSEACVAIGYLLNADGTTSDFAMLEAWSAGEPKQGRDEYWSAFAGDASKALAQWKFAPRPDVASPKPVYTVATFLFAAKDSAELRKRCAIPDLATKLVQMRYDARLSRKMSGEDVFARLDIDPLLEQRYKDMQRREVEYSRRNKAIQQGVPRPNTSSSGG